MIYLGCGKMYIFFKILINGRTIV